MEKELVHDILILAEKLKEDLQYLEFESVYYESINVLVLRGGDIQKEEYTNFIQILKDNISQILLANIDLPIKIDVKELIEDKVSDEADLLIKAPEQKETNIKVIGTASIFGCLLGLVIVMIFDYIKCCKKICIESRRQVTEL